MAYAARLVAKVHLAATPQAEPRHLSSFRVGALSRSTTVQRQKFVAKSAISAVESGDTFVGVKQNTRPIIVIDNYDSFTYNLCQYMGEVGANFEVYRNDEITVEEIKKLFVACSTGFLLEEYLFPQALALLKIQEYPCKQLQSLGPQYRCLGFAWVYSALERHLEVVRSPYGVVHGKGSLVHYDEKLDGTLFYDIPNPFQAGRYHSLVIEKDSFPHDTLEIVAWTDDGLIMAARHRIYKHIQGVQFHPESIITTEGRLMVNNFIKIIEGYEASNCSP
ncbi:Anthranilate synthase beta subunit 1 chloroplastic [Zea mays]|uniref:anthranilate synthase n=1 Tax=Zea mays TaxID=4577 RepID=A0A1D6L291_MAIZE|nr:Anthranilate synthase beta subunit 1 chloroplastic [Zea mays]